MLLQPGDNDCCCVGASETVAEIIVVSFSERSRPEPDVPAPLPAVKVSSSVVYKIIMQ